MTSWRLVGVVVLAALGLALASAGAASAKGVLEINNESGEHLPVGSKVSLRIAATISSPFGIEKEVHECVSRSAAELPSSLTVNGSKKDILGGTAIVPETPCTDGTRPAEEEMSGELREVSLSDKGKATINSAYDQFFVAGLVAELDSFGLGHTCRYLFAKLAGTFSSSAETLIITGTAKGTSFSEKGLGCLKHVKMNFTAELFEAEGAEDPLVPELLR